MLGFYTTRFVKTAQGDDVEDIVVNLIRNDKMLQSSTVKSSASTPMIFVEEIEELKRKPKFKGAWKLKNYGGGGFTFFPMNEEKN